MVRWTAQTDKQRGHFTISCFTPGRAIPGRCISILLERLRSQYDRADNPFVPAAQTLWDTYQASGDVAAACAAMEEAVRLRGDALLLPYTSERLEVEQVCPLD